MKKHFEVLRRCPLFDGIHNEELLSMLGCLQAKVTQFDKKYTIFSEGSPAKFIGIVLSGKAQIEQVDFYGNRSILAVAEPGELFAEAFACAQVQALPVSAVATEPSEIMLIDCARILHTCPNGCGFHQQMIFNLMKNLAAKNLQFHQKIEVLAKRTTRDKLLTYLAYQAKKAQCSEFTIPFDRQGLADYLEVDRSGLSAEIGKLRRERILDCHKNRFRLLT